VCLTRTRCLIEVRPGKQIVARSQGLSTRRNFVLLAHLSLVSSKSKQKSLFGEECQGMRVVYERCCGLDVHKKSVVACVLITPETHAMRNETSLVHTRWLKSILRYRSGFQGQILKCDAL